MGRGDAKSRLAIHAATESKLNLRQSIIFNNDLAKSEAKYLEQQIMDLDGGAKSTKEFTNLLNEIRSYSPANPNSVKYYEIAGHSSDWANKVLADALKKMKDIGL
jgi:hypothetical protein